VKEEGHGGPAGAGPLAHRSPAARPQCRRREVVQARVDLGPEAPLVKHTHPGEEIIYLLEGSLEYQVEGQPTRRTYNAGEALTVPAGVVHAVATGERR
jgi:quercetin dioxygenase-like cupin family protein